MSYSYDQLTLAYKAVHGGLAPNAATQTQLQGWATLNGLGQLTDAQVIGNIVNSADSTTAVAVLAYQFFTGKSPSAAGLAYLVNSTANPTDLNDAYYSQFSLENRFINFSANLGVFGEGAASFATKYGSMSYADFVASIYQTIIGTSYAQAAGIDPSTAIANIVARQSAIQASAGLISGNMTAAQIDLATKAATVGYLLGEAIKADVGLYAAANNNFMLALMQGNAVYNTNLTQTYAPPPDTGSHGNGHTVDRGPTTSSLPDGTTTTPTKPTGGQTFILTTGADLFTGTTKTDQFFATDTTFNNNDILDGGGGDDTLTITASGADYRFGVTTVSNIANLVVNNTSSVAFSSIFNWTRLKTVTVNAVGGNGGNSSISPASTTDATLNVSALGADSATISGGHNGVVNVTGVTGHGQVYTFDLSGTLTMAVDTTSTTGGYIRAGATGNITVTQTASNAVNTTALMGVVDVYGGAATTSVIVHNAAPATADNTHAGVTAQYVQVIDINYQNSSSATGVIRSLDVTNFNSLYIYDTGLTDLTLAHGVGSISINNARGGAPAATTLNLNLNDVRAYQVGDDGLYTTWNVTTNGTVSLFSFLYASALTTLNISGNSSFGVYDLTYTNLHTVTVTGAAGFGGNLTASGTVTSVDTSGSTGATSVTIDGAMTSYTGGAGVDSVAVSGLASHAISLGGGDDTLSLTGPLPLVTIDGGAGFDTLILTAAHAATFSLSNAFAAKVVNFEAVLLDAATNETVDIATLGPYHTVLTGAGAGLTMNGMVSGDTLALTSSGTAYTIGSTNFGGASEALNLKLSDDGVSGASVAFATTGITTSGVETFNITTVDKQTTPSGSFQDSVTLLDAGIKTITVGGNAGLNLTAASTALTNVDASGLTLGGFTWTSGALAGAATVKGAANGTNTVDVSAALGVITYEGGAGDDVVTTGNGLGNVIHLGAGNNYFIGSVASLTAGAGDDYARLSGSGGTVNLGDGHNVFISTAPGNFNVTTGSGADRIFLSGGAPTVNVGTGTDYVEIDAVDASSASNYASITGLGAGDQLSLTALNNANVMGAKITGQSTLAGYLNAAAADTAGATNSLHWFEFGGDVYIVSDASNAATFVNGVDAVVRLVGQAGALNAAAATVSGGLITFH